MIFQILRRSGNLVGLEIFRRADNCEPQILADTDRDHVTLDELTDLDASIVLSSYEINRVIRGRDLQDDCVQTEPISVEAPYTWLFAE